MFNLYQINSAILQNGELFIPTRLEQAIQESIESDYENVVKAGEELRQVFDPVKAKISVDYSRPDIIDAYTLFYTRRNSLIPRIALRDLLLNSAFLKLGPGIQVLDLGAGTGAVTLGILDLFTLPIGKGLTVSIHALDSSQACLGRLNKLVRLTGLPTKSVRTSNVELNSSP